MKGKFEFEGKKDTVLEQILQEINIVPVVYFEDDCEDIYPEYMQFSVRHLIKNSYEIRPMLTGNAQSAIGYECNDHDPRIVKRYSWPVGLEITYVDGSKNYVLKFSHCG